MKLVAHYYYLPERTLAMSGVFGVVVTSGVSRRPNLMDVSLFCDQINFSKAAKPHSAAFVFLNDSRRLRGHFKNLDAGQVPVLCHVGLSKPGGLGGTRCALGKGKQKVAAKQHYAAFAKAA